MPQPASPSSCLTFSRDIHANPEETPPAEYQGIEFVRPGQLLATLPDPEQGPNDGKAKPSRISLEAGDHTELSPQGNSLLATTYGFPQADERQGKEGTILRVSLIPLLRVSDDSMQAWLTLYPPPAGKEMPSGAEIVAALREMGLRFGLDEKLLYAFWARVQTPQASREREILVAQGLPAMNGKDAFLRFEMEIGPQPGKLLGDGRIDFRERKMFLGVRSGQLIATKVPATSGTPGSTVLGNPLPPKGGKDLKVKASDNSFFNEETGEVRAVKAGILTVVNEQDIKVCSRLVISGDIDYSTGNIDSYDAVEIGGSILPDFHVVTQGDLLINGNAVQAMVSAGGNITVKGGVLGNNCRLKGAGGIDLNFVEQAEVSCGGTLILRKEAYFCRIGAKAAIHCHESSRIMAATLVSGGAISVGQVGSANNSVPTILAAATDPDRFHHLLEIQAELAPLDEELILLLQRLGPTSQAPKRKKLEKKIATLRENLHHLNLIPGAESPPGPDDLERIRGIGISIHGQIFARTVLRIGNLIKPLTVDMDQVKFVVNSTGEQIVAVPLKGTD